MTGGFEFLIAIGCGAELARELLSEASQDSSVKDHEVAMNYDRRLQAQIQIAVSDPNNYETIRDFIGQDFDVKSEQGRRDVVPLIMAKMGKRYFDSKYIAMSDPVWTRKVVGKKKAEELRRQDAAAFNYRIQKISARLKREEEAKPPEEPEPEQRRADFFKGDKAVRDAQLKKLEEYARSRRQIKAYELIRARGWAFGIDVYPEREVQNMDAYIKKYRLNYMQAGYLTPRRMEIGMNVWHRRPFNSWENGTTGPYRMYGYDGRDSRSVVVKFDSIRCFCKRCGYIGHGQADPGYTCAWCGTEVINLPRMEWPHESNEHEYNLKCQEIYRDYIEPLGELDWDLEDTHEHVCEYFETDDEATLAAKARREVFSAPQRPKLTCPTCGSNSVEHISAAERFVSTATLGLASNKMNKTFKCSKCGYTW